MSWPDHFGVQRVVQQLQTITPAMGISTTRAQAQKSEQMKITGYNGTIGCKPIPITGARTVFQNGLAMTSQRVVLTAAEVVFGNRDINPGDTVYFAGEQETTDWAGTPVDVAGTKVILVPVDRIKLVGKPE